MYIIKVARLNFLPNCLSCTCWVSSVDGELVSDYMTVDRMPEFLSVWRYNCDSEVRLFSTYLEAAVYLKEIKAALIRYNKKLAISSPITIEIDTP